MKQAPLFFLGALATLSASWYGLVVAPRLQLGDLVPYPTTNETGTITYAPSDRSGAAHQGAEIYRSQGCAECHTQQIRSADEGSDLARGWGQRRSVARDYVYDSVTQLGNSRLGPDLANFGERLGTNAFPLIRLYDPRLLTNNTASLCPGAPYLFEVQKLKDVAVSTNALVLTGRAAPQPGTQVVPTLAAQQLAAYLGGLRQSVELPEAPLPKKEEAP